MKARHIMRRRWIIAALAIVIYAVTYTLLSLNGRYITANHGGQHWTRAWGPKYLVEPYQASTGRQREALTIPGVIYFPCLLLDRLLWHPEQDAFGPEEGA